MFYLTGDTHGRFQRILDFCKRNGTTTDDVMIILGDAGFNYHLNDIDKRWKKKANEQPITWLCIKGNHEKYAGALESYVEREAFGGKVYIEPDYPNIMFAKDGEVYTFIVDGLEKKVLVIGGAYSIDRYYRAFYGLNWFSDEQPSVSVKKVVEDKIKQFDGKLDYVFSHTCPERFEPTEWFLSGIDQETVDKSTEQWLDTIYDKLEVDRWYCGHYHGEKLDGNVQFMYEGYILLGQ